MHLYYMLNKPAGYVTARKDATHKTVLDLFPKEIASQIHPIGRLDIDTVGLLLLSSDGMADQALMQPERHVEKKYFFYAFGELTDEKIKAVENGLIINRNAPPTRSAKLEPINTFKVYELEKFFPAERREQFMKNPNGAAFSAILTVCEGRNHQVKLMMRKINCKVIYLKRLSVGEITLDESLPEGKYRELSENEINSFASKEPLQRIK